MARIRTLKPEFWQDEKLAPLAPMHRLVFLGLISQADDAGRLIDNPRLIDGLLFPESDDSSRESLEILHKLGRIIRYTSASGQKLIQIAGWEKHQKVQKPSPYVLPAPPDGGSSRNTPENVQRVSGESLSPTVDLGPTIYDPLTDTVSNETGDEPRVEESETPDAKTIHSTIAPLVREHLWLGKKPPSNGNGPPWTMDRELALAKQIMADRSIDLPEMCEVVKHARAVLEFKADVRLTLRIFNVNGRGDRLGDVLGYVRKRAEREVGRSGLTRVDRLLSGAPDAAME